MAIWKDSLGNVYRDRPSTGIREGQKHSAKPTTETSKRRSAKHRTPGGETKPTSKYARYRRAKGKPNGPGKPGNKSGKNKIR